MNAVESKLLVRSLMTVLYSEAFAICSFCFVICSSWLGGFLFLIFSRLEAQCHNIRQRIDAGRCIIITSNGLPVQHVYIYMQY